MSNGTRIKKGKYINKGYKYRGYEICNYGYVSHEKGIIWEAVDFKTGCGEFHARTLKQIKQMIDKHLNRSNQ